MRGLSLLGADCEHEVRRWLLIGEVRELAEKVTAAEAALPTDACAHMRVSGLVSGREVYEAARGLEMEDIVGFNMGAAAFPDVACAACAAARALFRRVRVLRSAWESKLLRLLVDYFVEEREVEAPYTHTTDGLILYKAYRAEQDGEPQREVCVCLLPDALLAAMQAADAEHAHMYECFDCLRELYVSYELFEDYWARKADCVDVVAAMKPSVRDEFWRYCPEKDEEKILLCWLNEDSKRLLRRVVADTRARVEAHFARRVVRG